MCVGIIIQFIKTQTPDSERRSGPSLSVASHKLETKEAATYGYVRAVQCPKVPPTFKSLDPDLPLSVTIPHHTDYG